MRCYKNAFVKHEISLFNFNLIVPGEKNFWFLIILTDIDYRYQDIFSRTFLRLTDIH